MARGTLSIHRLSQEARSKSAEKARDRVKAQFRDPSLQPHQRQALMKDLQWISKWESADVEDIVPAPVSTPPKVEADPSNTPTHHVVQLVETLALDENV